MPRRRVELPPIDDLRTWRAAMVTVQQLADYWQFHPFTITKWLRTGELEGTRFKGERPRRQESTTQWGARQFNSSPDLLPSGQGRYVDDQPFHKSESWVEEENGKRVTKTRHFTTKYDDEIDFPIALTKPVVLDAVGRAMALKVFDRIGQVQNTAGRDPIYVGQILDPRGGGRLTTFFLAWWVDTRSL